VTPDSDLLRQYSEHRDEAAFAEVVRRYVDLVYAAALRQTNGDSALAEDVTQATFTELARQASKLIDRTTLAGWLHTTARFLALRQVRTEHRRRTREQEALAMHETSTPPATLDLTWEQLRPILDEAVSQLNDEDRDAVLLRYFQNKTHREVGEQLGLSENTARMRVERALDKLRAQFSKRGVTTTAALLASALGALAAGTVTPAGFAGSLAEKSFAGAAQPKTRVPIAPLATLFTKLTRWRLTVLMLGAGIFVAILPWLSRPAATLPATNITARVPQKEVVAPSIASVPASGQRIAVPAKNNLGKIQVDDENSPAWDSGDLTYTLASGRLFKISEIHADPNGTIDIKYGVRSPEKAKVNMPDWKAATTLMDIDHMYVDTVVPGTPITVITSDGEPVSFIPLVQPMDLIRIGKVNVGDALPHPFTLHSGKIFVLLYTKYPPGESYRTPGYVWYYLYDSQKAFDAKVDTEGQALGGMPTAGQDMDMKIRGTNETVVFSLSY